MPLNHWIGKEMKDIESWKCPSCNERATTPFCPLCGEQPLSARHLTVRHLAFQAAEQFSSIDSKLFRSLRWLLVRPGVLTIAYVQGRRQGFVGPLQLFLIANVLFIAMQSLSHTNIFSTPLASHFTHQAWGEQARQLVNRRLAAEHSTLTTFAPHFDQAAVLNAKSLIILMVLAFSMMLPVFYVSNKRPFGAHIVFSLHLYAFLLVLFSFSLVIVCVSNLLGGIGLGSPYLDDSLSLFHLASCAIYLYMATGKVYRTTKAERLLKSISLAIVVAILVLAYRFAIFLIALYWA